MPRSMPWLIRQPMPIILVDWSDLHEDCRWQLLRAADTGGGRSITILDLVFPESMKGSPIAEKQLLQRLRRLLPKSVTPILVTDAGFRAPWFRAVARLGWHYVGRLRHRTLISVAGMIGSTIAGFYREPTSCPQRFKSVSMVANDPWHVDLVLYRKPTVAPRAIESPWHAQPFAQEPEGAERREARAMVARCLLRIERSDSRDRSSISIQSACRSNRAFVI